MSGAAISKLIPLSEAISRFVPDGSSAALGMALEGLIPFAAGHEIIRQGVRDLTLIGPISDILFDQIIGAGCVRKVVAAWVGNVITGSGYNFRRAVEGGHIEVEDHSKRITVIEDGYQFLHNRGELPGTHPGRGEYRVWRAQTYPSLWSRGNNTRMGVFYLERSVLRHVAVHPTLLRARGGRSDVGSSASVPGAYARFL